MKSNVVAIEKPTSKAVADGSWVGRIPQLRPGTYADGLPFHELDYLACKLVLRANPFTSRARFFDFAEVMRKPAGECRVGLTTKGFKDKPLKIREVLFIDTPDFRLYNNAFILRRRIAYRDGFPIGDPEIVFKFRHSDLQLAAESDVRPQIRGDHRVKFKCQALPLKDRLGGVRLHGSARIRKKRSSWSITPSSRRCSRISRGWISATDLSRLLTWASGALAASTSRL
jgi:hypothetical protein